MIDLSYEDRKEALGEVLADELKAIREHSEYLLPVKNKVDAMDQRLIKVENDVSLIRAVVTDQSKQMKKQDIRLTRLESTRV